MKPIHQGGDLKYNLLFLSLLAITFLSAIIYWLKGNPLWFSRFEFSIILLAIINKKQQ